MAYESSTTYLLTRLPHAGNQEIIIYIIIMEGKYNFFIWNSSWIVYQSLGWCLCETPEVGASLRLSYKFNNNLRTSK